MRLAPGSWGRAPKVCIECSACPVNVGCVTNMGRCEGNGISPPQFLEQASNSVPRRSAPTPYSTLPFHSSPPPPSIISEGTDGPATNLDGMDTRLVLTVLIYFLPNSFLPYCTGISY